MREAIESAAPCRRAERNANSAQLLQNPRTDPELVQSSHRALQNSEGFNPPPPPGGPAHCAGRAHNFVLKTALFSCSVFAPIFASFGLPRGPQNGAEIEEFRVRFSRALRSRSRDPLRDDFAWFPRSFRATFPNVFPTFAEKCKVHENTLYACFREGRELRKPSESRPETMPENRFARGNLFGCSEVRFGVVLASRATPK